MNDFSLSQFLFENLTDYWLSGFLLYHIALDHHNFVGNSIYIILYLDITQVWLGMKFQFSPFSGLTHKPFLVNVKMIVNSGTQFHRQQPGMIPGIYIFADSALRAHLTLGLGLVICLSKDFSDSQKLSVKIFTRKYTYKRDFYSCK